MQKFAVRAALASVAFFTAASFAANAPAPAAAAQGSAHHALWTVKGKTNTVYLLGSVHFLSPMEQLPAVVDAAYKDAEKIVMEIDMDDLDPMAMQSTAMELG